MRNGVGLKCGRGNDVVGDGRQLWFGVGFSECSNEDLAMLCETEGWKWEMVSQLD